MSLLIDALKKAQSSRENNNNNISPPEPSLALPDILPEPVAEKTVTELKQPDETAPQQSNFDFSLDLMEQNNKALPPDMPAPAQKAEIPSSGGISFAPEEPRKKPKAEFPEELAITSNNHPESSEPVVQAPKISVEPVQAPTTVTAPPTPEIKPAPQPEPPAPAAEKTSPAPTVVQSSNKTKPNTSSANKNKNTGTVKTPMSAKQRYGILGGILLLTLAGIGAYFYWSLNQVDQPMAAAPMPPMDDPTMMGDTTMSGTDTDVNASSSVVANPSPDEPARAVSATEPSAEPINNTASEIKTTVNPSKTNDVAPPAAPPTATVASNNKTTEPTSPAPTTTEHHETTTPAAPPSKPRVVRNTPSKPASTVDAPANKETSSAASPTELKSMLDTTPVRSPLESALGEAYQLYQQGQWQAAAERYQDAEKLDGQHRDVLLGLAVVYQKLGQNERARQYYEKQLQQNSSDPVAMSGLLSLGRNGNSQQHISQLKQLLQHNPKLAHLHFALGNEYGNQSRWAEAQQAYFSAYSLAPHKAEYAYNLAVSLEKLGEIRAARDYYQKALDKPGEANFDRQRLQNHLQQLRATGS